MRPSQSADAGRDSFDLLTAFLDHDDRATFILNAHNGSQPSELVYQNKALHDFVERLGSADSTHDVGANFSDWASKFESSRARERDGGTCTADRTHFGGRQWTSFMLKNRWRVVYSVTVDDESNHATKRDRSLDGTEALQRTSDAAFPSVSAAELRLKAGLSDTGSQTSEEESIDHDTVAERDTTSTPTLPPSDRRVDWIMEPPERLPAFYRFFLDYDWASTPLGPIENWPNLLRQTVVMILASPDPRLLLWGRQMCVVYNEACLALIGQKHPSALGHEPTEVFSELWKPIKSIVKVAMQQGKATRVQDLQLTINRNKSFGPEETYWSFTMLPIIDADGTAVGALDEFVETTGQVISERRINTLIELGEKTGTAGGIKDLWRLILSSLDTNPQDVPFALLYSVSDDGVRMDDAEEPQRGEPKQCFLEGSVGITDDHPAAIQSFVLTEGEGGFSVPFRRAWTSAQPALLQESNGTLPKEISKLKAPGRGFDDESTTAIALPIPPLSGTSIRGFLILGMNPRRPYDEDYQVFLRLLNDRLVKAVASIFLPEEQRRSREIIEENNSRHNKFSRELERRRQEAESAEATFTALAECAPIGCAVFQLDGQPRWMNQAYLSLLGLRREDFGQGPDRWSSTIMSDDRPFVEEQWRKVAQGDSIRPFEFRVKRPWNSPDSTDGSHQMGFSWILANAFLEHDDGNNPQRVLGWLTDISHQKWSQHLQAQRLEDALETKRQSENFIDMTSHEMRNPLSAILQSAEGILSVLGYNKDNPQSLKPHNSITLDAETQENVIDSAQTVVLCAQHQKRIVDDILTLSKLDSNLLVISPDISQPVTLVERAVKMYETELNNAHIKLTLSIHQSYEDLCIDTVLLDPSRVLQVLINLLTNAIKFTRDRDKRVINIFLSASYKQPSSGHGNLAYIPRRATRPEHTFSDEWGAGEDIYLQLTVEDTGKGLSGDEMKLLFHRFSQASPKTYGEYGGSGLGLFISRELTELQGGQIGVASQAGNGSTFAFYVKTRRYIAEKCDSTPPSPIEPLRSPPLRRLSAPKENPSAESTNADPMPLTSASDPSWTISGTGSHIAMKDVAPVNPVEADPAALYPDLKVLIVEDNFINQRVLAQQLRRAGCTIYLANHGLEALTALKRSTFTASSSSSTQQRLESPKNSEPTNQPAAAPDPSPTTKPTKLHSRSSSSSSLAYRIPFHTDPTDPPVDISVLLMDLEMPVMDGLSCIKRIREMQRQGTLRRHVPVIAVTANARSEQIAVAMNAGMDLVITKPFRIPELLPQMDRLVRRMEPGTSAAAAVATVALAAAAAAKDLDEGPLGAAADEVGGEAGVGVEKVEEGTMEDGIGGAANGKEDKEQKDGEQKKEEQKEEEQKEEEQKEEEQKEEEQKGEEKKGEQQEEEQQEEEHQEEDSIDFPGDVEQTDFLGRSAFGRLWLLKGSPSPSPSPSPQADDSGVWDWGTGKRSRE